jgi:hypothetical protein
VFFWSAHFFFVLIFQEGVGHLFTPTPYGSGFGLPGIPYIFIFLLGIIMIVFPLQNILTSKKKTGNDS